MSWGVAVDIGISTVSAAFGPGWAIAGGAAGGFLGSVLDGGSPSDHFTAAAYGAGAGLVGGALGAGGAWAARAGLGRQVTKADDALKVVQNRVTPLQNNVATRETDLKNAKDAYSNLFSTRNPSLFTRGMNRLSGRQSMPQQVRKRGVTDDMITTKLDDVRKAEKKLNSAKAGVARAQADEKKASDLVDAWKTRQGWFASKDADKWYKRGRPAWEKGGTKAWGSAGLQALGGFGAAGLRNWSAGEDGGPGGGSGDPQTDRVAAPGIWVGGHVESMGEGQFKPGPGSGPPGQPVGFLFQPEGISADLQSWYGAPGGGSLADGLSDNWQLFGDSSNFETDKATVPPLPTVPMQIGAQTPAVYQEAASRLVQTAGQFDAMQEEVAKSIVETAENTELGREQISALIRGINLKAQTSDGTDASFVDLLGQAFAENLSTMEERSGTNSEIAKVIADMEARMNAQLEEDRKALEEAMKKWQELPQGPGNPYNPGVPPGQPSPNDPSSPLPTLPTPNIPTPSDPSKPSDPGRLPGTPGSPSNPGGRDPGSPNPGSPNDPTKPSVPTPVTPPAGDMGSGLAGMGSNLMSSLWPLLAAQQGGMFGQRGPLGNETDPRRFDRERLSPVQPPQVQPPQTQPTTPPGQQSPQGTGTPPGQPATHTGPTPGATAPQDSGTPPRTARSDGKVLYDFKDGRTQYVYPKVYDALEAAFADTKGTDARAAYGMESGKSGEPKDKYPGSRVDPNQLMTGDIAMWEDGRTALLVVFGDENGGPSGGGTLEVIVDGVLTEFGPEMSDAEGDFGAFAGFFHPPGIEESASGSTAGDVVPATDPTVQPVPAMPVSAVG
ncbi:hypothetical protein [Nocardia otitidiscaviarum]|uniref:hypothetical protein n=1 Tax=Nocardia otitidiscaviarum TaxID=1823 RepID=UPI00130DED77|nr:hypothetical protein [Nocardia otitidiscaviarum]